jgi:hypothetical protein
MYKQLFSEILSGLRAFLDFLVNKKSTFVQITDFLELFNW